MKRANVVLAWTLESAPEGYLKLAYSLTNRDTTSIYVLDLITVFGAREGIELDPTGVIIRVSPSDPSMILFTRGYVSPPRSDVAFELMPGARIVEPGATVNGLAHVQLPLKDTHPNELSIPIETNPDKAVLELGLLPGDVPMHEQALNDGDTVTAPSFSDAYRHQELVPSDPLPLP